MSASEAFDRNTVTGGTMLVGTVSGGRLAEWLSLSKGFVVEGFVAVRVRGPGGVPAQLAPAECWDLIEALARASLPPAEARAVNGALRATAAVAAETARIKDDAVGEQP